MIEEMDHDDPATRTLPQVAVHHPHQQQHDNSRICAGCEEDGLLSPKEAAFTTLPGEPAELVVISTPRRLPLEQQEQDKDEEKGEEKEEMSAALSSSFLQHAEVDSITCASRLTLSTEMDPCNKGIQPTSRLKRTEVTTRLSPSSLLDHHELYGSSVSTTAKEVPPAPAPTPRGVSFAMVEIREHPIIVGDHPGVKKGVPLSIGWDSVDHIALHVDRYEAARSHRRRPPRSMRLVAEHREQLLRTLGFSREEMLWGQANAKLVRKLREKTNNRLSLDRFHEVWESIGRKVRNLMTLGKFKRRQKEYLQKHVPSYNDLEALTSSATTSTKDDPTMMMTKRQSFIGGSTTSSNTWLEEANRRGSSSSILSVRSLQESLCYLSEDEYF